MDTSQEGDLNNKARFYFLQQGQRVIKINDLLNSNILEHHISKWFSIFLELALYSLFIIAIVFLIIIPTDISAYLEINENSSLELAYENKTFLLLIWVIKTAFFILSLPVLFLAILIRRNRRKNNIIYKAYKESATMKEEFDKAVKELKL